MSDDFGPDDPTLAPVLRTTDGTLLNVVKSLLEVSEIPFIVQGEAAVSLFPLGEAGAEVTGRTTGAIILVPGDRAEEAKALIETTPE